MPTTGSTRRPRADAARNRDAILDAALRALNADPSASIAAIATEAGISRITFYGHFSSREELVDAVARRAMERINARLDETPGGGDPWPALENLIQTQWRLVDELHGLVRVAADQMPAERLRELHAGPMSRVRDLIQAGRDDGSFRTDQALSWQLTCFFGILHGAAEELRSGRLSEDDASRVIPETIHALLRR